MAFPPPPTETRNADVLAIYGAVKAPTTINPVKIKGARAVDEDAAPQVETLLPPSRIGTPQAGAPHAAPPLPAIS